ncbi:MAG: hypothetical protein ACOCYQ_07235, partial [Alkalispirochaeta sp.]
MSTLSRKGVACDSGDRAQAEQELTFESCPFEDSNTIYRRSCSPAATLRRSSSSAPSTTVDATV